MRIPGLLRVSDHRRVLAQRPGGVRGFLAVRLWCPAGSSRRPGRSENGHCHDHNGPIDVDGALNEPVWRTAPKIGDLVQRQPDEGEAPTERTEVTLLRDEAQSLHRRRSPTTREPERVIGTQMARDASLTADDRIEILLDTFRDQRSAFYFATNPAGALVDGLAFANGQLNTDWDAIWDVRTRRTDEGWVAEFAIPFKSLSFPAGRDGLGLQHLPHDLSEARGRPLVGRAAPDAVPAGVRGRRDHQPRRA